MTKRTPATLLAAAAIGAGVAVADADEKPHVVVVHGEDEYGSSETMPALAAEIEGRLGFTTTVLTSPEGTRVLPDLTALDDADLLILFLRFRETGDGEALARLGRWFADGNPAVAFRTTSHAFWGEETKGWFPPIFGGHYKAHAPNGPGTDVFTAPGQLGHPVLRGVKPTYHAGHGGTYNAQPLEDFVTPLVFGRTGDFPAEPVAWTAGPRRGQRLFYTSLGAADNFERAPFRNMVLNSILWCLRKDVPGGGVLDLPVPHVAPHSLDFPPTPAIDAPDGATVLFDGGDLSAFRHYDPSVEPRATGIDGRADTSSGGSAFDGARWDVSAGAAVARPGFGDILTTGTFSNYRVGFDFLIPDQPGYAKGQWRGNSGVYLDGRFEVQILATGGVENPDKTTMGAVFGQKAPDIAAAGEPGTWQHMEIAFKGAAEGDHALLSAWLNGKQIHDNVELTDPTVYGFLEPRQNRRGATGAGGGEKPWFAANRKISRQLNMGGDFTLAVRFRTEEGEAVLAGKNSGGPWTENGKVFFLRDNRLHYDIGWVGVIEGETDCNDGGWHNAVLTFRDGVARIFLDGEPEAERRGFTAPDVAGHRFKVGHVADDFPEDDGTPFLDGDLGHVMFWNRGLPDAELASLGKNRPADVNTPDLNWRPDPNNRPTRRPAAKPAAPSPTVATAGPAGPLRFQADSAPVRFANIWVAPLADVDHARLVRGWDHNALDRGAKIYNGLCITCHGSTEVEGTLPTALRFHEGELKNGNDPYRMFETVSNGFGQMVPQTWMTPRQKYDVIHYIRETFLKPHNKGQYTEVTDAYLAALPVGLGTGPDEALLSTGSEEPQYKKMDYGPYLFWTYQVADGNIAYKGLAVRLDPGPGGVSKGRAWMVYDHDTMRVAAAYTGDAFVDWRGIAFDGSHGTHTSIVGDKLFVNPVGPGVAQPGDGSWEDPRLRGRDGKPYGPLPRDWAHYKGLFIDGDRVVLKYTIGGTDVLESPSLTDFGETPIFARTFNIAEADRDITWRLAPEADDLTVTLAGGERDDGTALAVEDGFTTLHVSAAATPSKLTVFFTRAGRDTLPEISGAALADLGRHTRGGPARWTETVTTTAATTFDDGGAFAIDTLTTPDASMNPWGSWMRLGGFDFDPNNPNKAAICTWMGDVWTVEGIAADPPGELRWKRVATGLFQALGLKYRGGEIFVTCRDQIARLHDLDGDGETDYVESFNNDHQVTEHFHEFAMGLQTDGEGNFYYAKSARHALTALVPHHGTLLKVSKDGSETEILAAGFRAANGVCLNPDGSFIVTDQEGHWNPKNRINYVQPGGFYGNMFGYHDVTDASDDAMDQPLCWITNSFDRSPAELLWVPDDAAWGALNGSLLNLSYGYGQVYIVPHETVGEQPSGSGGVLTQGGMCALPVPRQPTGIMRGRFSPADGQLYTCGMFAWAGSQQEPGGFYRVRHTGLASHLPVGIEARNETLRLTFSDPLDRDKATDASGYRIKAWDLKRTKNYGSEHYDERAWEATRAELSSDGKTVTLTVPELAKTWSMEVRCTLAAPGAGDGDTFERVIHNTVHTLEVAERP